MVGYRAWTLRTARELGVAGFVRNLADGRVEIFAEGDAQAIDALATRCWQGPSHAHVGDVTRVVTAVRGAHSFVLQDDAARPG